MILIVGLGNPGKKYQNTRHNLGFMILDKLAKERTNGQWTKIKKLQSEIIRNPDFTLAKPQTMMNLSGLAVAKITNFYKIKPENIWVVHDEIDLPLGGIKIAKGRGSAGHKGVESIIKELGTDQFIRFRLGIGRPGFDSNKKEIEDYVLTSFGKEEKNRAETMIIQVVKTIEETLEKGLDNGKISRFSI
jgi:PTH1 family peptidyl-tRNA hydrolase